MQKFRLTMRLAACAAVVALASAAPAEDFVPQRASAYAEVTKWPDWSGVWSPDWSTLFGPGGRAGPTALTPAAKAKHDAYLAAQKDGKNVQTAAANCRPTGMPGIMRQPYPIEFIYSPGRVTLFAETYSQARRIYVDGRPLPSDPEALFNGYSVGHWDGDALEVDTVGFTPLSEIAPGVPHSDKMKIHERIHLVSPDRIMIDTTITDPEVLSAPYTYSQAYDRKADWEIREYVCDENNRDSADSDGRAHLDLGLDDQGDPFGPPPDDDKGGK